jgi:DNA-binding CsgD family transcriptional regulator
MTKVRGETAAAGTGPSTPIAEGLLERSAQLAVLEQALAAVTDAEAGRVVLVSGEAGIGKTTLLRAFGAGLGSVRVLSGACDSLITPRPLGPLADIAEQTGGELALTLEQSAGAGAVLSALGRELRRRRPTVVVLEDLHWADEATLDLLRLLGRRIEMMPALVVATYRDDELDRSHPLRIVLGELPRANVTRLPLNRWSLAAVADLAQEHGIDPEELHRSTSGNPFYVTEALAAGGSIPGSVRDAVLARAARLDADARALLDAVAIVPGHAELRLLEALAGEQVAQLERCLASGMLRSERDRVYFRHEIARVVVEEALPPDRAVALHRRALEALVAARGERDDLARIAHHAEAAGDGQAVLRYAPPAGERAAAVGAHREAAAQFARALRFADGLGRAERAGLLERRSYECYLTDDLQAAIQARRLALSEHTERGDRLRAGDTHRWLSRLFWFSGDNTTASAEAEQAIELLETLPPGPELAMAYSNMAQLAMLADDVPQTRLWGTRAIELAERLGDTETLVHALNNVGTVELHYGTSDAVHKLERSLALSLQAGLDEHVARAYTNLGAGAIMCRDYELGDRNLRAGIDYCHERDLDAWGLYMTGWRARSQLDQGQWDLAAASATAVVELAGVPAASRITPLAVLGRLRARRGDPDPWAPLDEAAELARPTGELQRLAPVATARAEAHWLAGQATAVAPDTDAALQLAVAREDKWAIGELCLWRRRAGIEEASAAVAAEPFALELAGDAAGAARWWQTAGCPYDAAMALAFSDSEDALRRSLAELQRLGARPAVARVARTLRERGARDLRQGPRSATLENPALLTARELEVLQLLSEGLRNAQIAECLVVARKTVDHHVSAILRKLDSSTRTQAVAEAARLGIFDR